ncbi:MULTISPECIES: ComEA family DNA-binding protein [Pseudomonas]|uniref:ComEA family DNA-binding protein n=1 Tax=Pseudomonas TaxID=286 RepID=UPI00029ACAE5|nr:MULTISPECIES: helix-hairpin-helix domain-containing protein [Pseudomonas]QQO00595.1 helix-hairpin-helix domain-containing protein [Pseudomonas sp. SW-3]
MRTGYIYSLVFALLTSGSIAAIAAPTVTSDPATPSLVQDVAQPTQTGKVDLNSADATILQRELAGVGEAKAKAIVAYRDSNGSFASLDELLEVKGIGKAILERNREKLEVN